MSDDDARGGAAGEAQSVRARLAELLGDGHPRAVDLVRRLVTGFPAKSTLLLERLSAAGADVGEAVQAVHALRGAASNLGSVELTALCQQVEHELPVRGAAVVVAREQALRDAVDSFARLLPVEAGSVLPGPASSVGSDELA
jgi:HPt (histidine-containing phosphotransfer) domain-containing protein